MIRTAASCGCLILGLLLGSAAAAADPAAAQPEPPLRLKKKVKPQPEAAPSQRPAPPRQKAPKAAPPPSREPKETPEPSAQDLEERIREITNRVSKNMNRVEERLHQHDPGEITQQTQQEILRDLDQLIEQTRRQPPQPPPSSSSASAPQATNKGRRQPNQPRDQAAPSSPNQQAMNPGGNKPRPGKSSPQGASKIADLYKDVWGHLPEALRQEMDQYAREQFMAKYSDLLKQYYATIAEKGRRKGEP